MSEFKRGDVFNVYVPPLKKSDISPPPSFILEGRHKFVTLFDSDNRDMPGKSVLAVPITSAAKSVSYGNMKPSFVLLDKARHPFLDHDSYIATHQAMPLSRHWLGEVPVGKIHPTKMVQVDLQLIQTLGLRDTVDRLMASKASEQLKEFERGINESAPTRDKGMER